VLILNDSPPYLHLLSSWDYWLLHQALYLKYIQAHHLFVTAAMSELTEMCTTHSDTLTTVISAFLVSKYCSVTLNCSDRALHFQALNHFPDKVNFIP
jgi:hypothetical protein